MAKLGIGSRLIRAAGAVTERPGELMRATVLLPPVIWRLRRGGFRATAQWLDDRHRPAPDLAGPPATDQLGLARDLGFTVRLAARLVPDASCLRKSLVHRELLKRHGIPAEVRLGAAPASATSDGPDDKFDFHAWLEVGGEVVSEDPASVAHFVTVDGDD